MKSAILPFTLWAALLLNIGCAGPLDERAYQTWDRIDRDVYLGRHVDLKSSAQRPDDAGHENLPFEATLDDFVSFGVRHHPGLEAAFYRWRAALERVPQATALPDPQVSFGIVLDEVDRDARYMGERYSIQQMFPWFGKLQLRGDVAMEDAHAEAQRYEAQRLLLIERVTEAYTEHAFLLRSIAVARENRDLLASLEEVSRAMFRAGTVSQADVSRAQVELGRLEDQVRSLEDLLGASAGSLNAAIGRPAHAPIPSALPMPGERDLVAFPPLTDEQWVAAAHHANPELAATRHMVARRRNQIALARKEALPDVMVGVEYARDGSARMAMMDRGGADMIMPMVSVNIPLWREKYNAMAREALAGFGEATRQLQDEGNNLEVELKRALYTYRDAHRKLDLYRNTLLPLARQSLATSESAYRAGEAGFSDLIDAQRVLLEFELAYERAAADRAQSLARVQMFVGGNLEEIAATQAADEEQP